MSGGDKDNVINQYKSFGSKKEDFRKKYNMYSLSSSDSESEESSSDDFPSPGSPKRDSRIVAKENEKLRELLRKQDRELRKKRENR